MVKKYHGVIPPIITPVDERENVDEQGFRALLEHCVQGGLHGIFVAGTNGEALALTQTERDRAIAIALDQLAGRIPLFCGVMDSSTRRVADNIRRLEQMGGTCAVVTSIFYARHTSQEETVRHFEQISAQTDIDLILYNIPSMTGMALSAGTVTRIAQMDRVMGYKDSSTAYGDFLQILAQFKDSAFSCLQGMTPQAVSALLMGADGFVPALAPLFPRLFVAAYKAGKSGNIALALRYDEVIRASQKILTCGRNMTACAKYAISTLGLTNKRVIQPQDGLAPEEEKAIDRQIDVVRGMAAALEEAV